MPPLPAHRVIPVMALVACLACNGEPPSLPTAPSELVQGIVVYEHANFQGVSAHIARNIEDLKTYIGPCEETTDNVSSFNWNDCISSVRVAPGWEATLYRGDDYEDDSIVVTEDVPNLQSVGHDCHKGGLNDCVTSIQVRQR